MINGSKIFKRLGEVEPIQLDPARPDPESIARVLEERLELRIGRIRILADTTGCTDASASLALYEPRVRRAGVAAQPARGVDREG